jgi:CBS domain-containing protein
MKKIWIEIPANCSLDEGIKSLLISGSRLIIVKSSPEKILGILTEGDLLRSLSDHYMQISTLRLEIVANRNFLYVSNKDEFEKNIKTFISSNVLYVPVMDKNRNLLDVIDVNKWLIGKCDF